MRKLSLKKSTLWLLNQRMGTVIKEKKLIERMSITECLQFFNLQSMLAWNQRETEVLKYAFRKRLPEFAPQIQERESLIRATLISMANLEICKNHEIPINDDRWR